MTLVHEISTGGSRVRQAHGVPASLHAQPAIWQSSDFIVFSDWKRIRYKDMGVGVSACLRKAGS